MELSRKNNKADLRILAVGALAGLVIAAIGILQRDAPPDMLPENSIARVNDVLIGRDVYKRAISRATNYAGQPVDGDDAMTLQRLIEDELLIQRGVELGMTRSDAAVRQALIDSLIASVTAEADAASPGQDELEQYLADNADRFSFIAKVSAQAWQTDNESVAQAFIGTLRAEGTGPTDTNVQPMPDLPAGLMTLDILAAYVGPGIAAAAAEMPVGSSAIFARRGRWLVVRIDDKERSTLTDLSTIRNRVLLDYRRNLAQQALETYIEDLRQRASISVATP
jgi:hypothetical protein